MVLISEKINYVITSTIALMISIIVFSLSGITKNHILMPLNVSFDFLNEINFVYLLISIIFFALSLSITSLFILKSKTMDLKVFIAPSIGAILILIFANISLITIFLSLGLLIGTLVMVHSLTSEKEEYKKISAYKISTHGASKLLLIVLVGVRRNCS